MILAGIVVLVASWLPLLASGLLQPAEDPLHLSLVSLVGSIVGVALVAAASFRRHKPPAR